MLLQGMMGPITCVAAHPRLPRIVVLCNSGDIHLWDYDLKVVVYAMRTAVVMRSSKDAGVLYPR